MVSFVFCSGHLYLLHDTSKVLGTSKRRLIAPVPIWMFPLPQSLLTVPRLWIFRNFGGLGRVGRDYREIRWWLWILSESTGHRAGISESTWDWGQHTCHGITWDKGFLCIRRMCFTTAKWESADRCRKSCKGLSKHRGLLDIELISGAVRNPMHSH